MSPAHTGGSMAVSVEPSRWYTSMRLPGWTSTRSRRPRSDIGVALAADHLVALDQLRDAGLEGHLGPEACGLDLRVAHDVVALVRVPAHGGLLPGEARHLLADGLAQFALGQVRLAEPHVVGLPAHALPVAEAMADGAGHVPDVDVVALEVPLEEDHEPVGDGAVGEVVHQEVQPQAGAPVRQASGRIASASRRCSATSVRSLASPRTMVSAGSWQQSSSEACPYMKLSMTVTSWPS